MKLRQLRTTGRIKSRLCDAKSKSSVIIPKLRGNQCTLSMCWEIAKANWKIKVFRYLRWFKLDPCEADNRTLMTTFLQRTCSSPFLISLFSYGIGACRRTGKCLWLAK